jgi:hypothetical protein
MVLKFSGTAGRHCYPSAVPTPNTPTRRLLQEIVSPRLSLFDDSSTRERQSALSGRIAEYAIITFVVLVIAGMEIARWKFNAPPQPLVFGFAAACLTIYAVARVGMILREIAVLKRESHARANLRSAIDDICSRGWLLFDGLTDGRGHLLGSVLAGPAGVFTLVPRFIPRGGNLLETIRQVDGGALMIDTHLIPADPVGQARRAAHALYEVLAASGMDTVPVQAVVVFPGWKIEAAAGEDSPDVWVLGERDISAKFSQLPTQLEARDVIAVSMLLEQLAKK